MGERVELRGEAGAERAGLPRAGKWGNGGWGGWLRRAWKRNVAWCLAAQLVPLRMTSERNIEQCSPSVSPTAAIGVATARKSPSALPSYWARGELAA